MLVRAKFQHGGFGFYDSKRRRDGDEFSIDPDHFSEKWMVKVEVEEEKPKKKRGRKPKVEEVVSDSDNDVCESEE